LGIPASQELVLSLAGLLTQHLRNKVGVENMAATVFITKNVDLAREVSNILKSTYVPQTCRATLADDVHVISEVHEAMLMATVCEAKVPEQKGSNASVYIAYADYVKKSAEE
jgi:predicted oxidoreductase